LQDALHLFQLEEYTHHTPFASPPTDLISFT